MGLGLQCFDASGTLTFNATDYLARFVGTITLDGTNGSQTVSGLTALGTPIYIFASNGDGLFYNPVLSNSGDTIIWTYPDGGAGTNSTGTIFYGVK